MIMDFKPCLLFICYAPYVKREEGDGVRNGVSFSSHPNRDINKDEILLMKEVRRRDTVRIYLC
jgi:hypothetical protein